MEHFTHGNHLFQITAHWSNNALIRVVLDNAENQPIYNKSSGFPKELAQWFQAYGEGKEENFFIPLCWMQGSENQKKVWKALQDIPYGIVMTYGMLAEKVFGNKKYARTVGHICGKNPIPLIIPCHRVVGAGKSLGGYSVNAGIAMKIALLKHEGVDLS